MASGVIKRVNIDGQFDPSNAYSVLFCTGRSPIRVNREQLTFDSQPSNWNTLCDEVDTVLQKLLKPRSTVRVMSVIAMVVFLFLVFGNIGYRLLLKDVIGDYMYLGGAYFGLVFVTILVLVVMTVRIRVTMGSVFGEVLAVCDRYSVPNQVTYSLKDEYWGNCASFTSRRRFLNVIISHDPEIAASYGAGGVAAVEASSYPVNPTVTTTATSVNNTDSLFNQLASKM